MTNNTRALIAKSLALSTAVTGASCASDPLIGKSALNVPQSHLINNGEEYEVPQYTEQQLYIMAITLWGEARSDGRVGMEAVAAVILNRMKKRNQDVIRVCKQPYQFSMWNKDAVGVYHRKILDAALLNDISNVYKLVTRNGAYPREMDSFEDAMTISRDALMGRLTDPTEHIGGADHYHVTSMPKKPNWARRMEYPRVRIGSHTFYTINEDEKKTREKTREMIRSWF